MWPSFIDLRRGDGHRDCLYPTPIYDLVVYPLGAAAGRSNSLPNFSTGFRARSRRHWFDAGSRSCL